MDHWGAVAPETNYHYNFSVHLRISIELNKWEWAIQICYAIHIHSEIVQL